MNVVDSPPGTTSPSSPSSCSGLRTSTTPPPSRRSTAACSRTFPCTASTPIFTAEMLVADLVVEPRDGPREQPLQPPASAEGEQDTIADRRTLDRGGERHATPL